MFSNNYRHILLSYTLALITSMSLALSISVLFILIKYLINEKQFSTITFVVVLIANAPAADVSGTITVPLTSMYTYL